MNKNEKSILQALSAVLILMATGVIALSLLMLSAPANAQGFFKKKAEPAQASAAAPAASAAPAPVVAPPPVPAPIKPTPMVAPPPPQPFPAVAPAFPPVPPAAPFPTKPLPPPAAPSKAQAPLPLAKPAQAVKPVRPARPAANASIPVAPRVGPGAQSNQWPNSGASNAERPIPARPVPTQQSPSQACGNLNFIAKALCVSVNCVLPEFKGSAECVRLEQDRINNDRSRESYGGG